MSRGMRPVSAATHFGEPMANRVYETMTQVHACGFKVRVWRAAAELVMGPEEDIFEKLSESVWKDADDIASEIEKFEGVAAYEIVDAHGNGVICYPDWS